MNVAMMRKLVKDGLIQPKAEPSFFVYPSGYSLSTPSTAYTTTEARSEKTTFEERHAKLDPSS